MIEHLQLPLRTCSVSASRSQTVTGEAAFASGQVAFVSDVFERIEERVYGGRLVLVAFFTNCVAAAHSSHDHPHVLLCGSFTPVICSPALVLRTTVGVAASEVWSVSDVWWLSIRCCLSPCRAVYRPTMRISLRCCSPEAATSYHHSKYLISHALAVISHAVCLCRDVGRLLPAAAISTAIGPNSHSARPILLGRNGLF